MLKINPAILAFEDGTILRGKAFGASKTVTGEAVFNTSITGYQEILTDPSYHGQLVTMTAPQIGNYGISPEDGESDKPQVRGFIIRELSRITSNWRSTKSLDSYLKEYDIPGIEGIDTRFVTKKIRTMGALKICLSTENIDPELAVKKAQTWDGISGHDYISQVTCKEPYHYLPPESQKDYFTVPGTYIYNKRNEVKRFKVAAFDFGAKKSIFNKLALHNFDVHVVPAHTPIEVIRDTIKPDALFLSNGPGDPAAVPTIHANIAELIKDYPTFGICMGHQIICHALGAKTFKLKFGHHGGNQPVKNLETGRVSITAQNHGFASTKEEIENCGCVVTEINLNDGTVEGLRHKDLPVFSVQYHPEAAPGPNDADPLFEDFYNLVKKHTNS